MLARILGGAGAVALALVLIWLYGSARFDAGKFEGTLSESRKWQARVDQLTAQVADLRVANERKAAQAAGRYVETIQRIQPIVVRSSQEVRDYAETPAGAVVCLAADRVRGIDADAAALGLQAAPAADSGDAALPANGDDP